MGPRLPLACFSGVVQGQHQSLRQRHKADGGDPQPLSAPLGSIQDCCPRTLFFRWSSDTPAAADATLQPPDRLLLFSL